ncbi:hypothetical protein HNP82_002944 [Catenibacillus scindens]|uniref:Uroporphyrinogen decarboxylase (URO-D) domain-containing protein n=1 Tax=Catenibacillus scindens TaxID=673271 RepID=A0A7W8M602_9FIRM|nr:uroporphyrinogen decarboxylase family protein [Catenibacillus scindens]MBB5265793.1 hypothetical protein [Catenibacillus scindens]
MTEKEKVLAMLAGEPVEGLVRAWEPFAMLWDPISAFITPARQGATVKDAWGVTLSWKEDQPGIMPLEGEEYLVCPDITQWREKVIAPDIEGQAFDYTGVLKQKEEIHAQGKIALGFSPIGIFELLHNLLGFENALMDFLLEPEEMHDLIDYLTDFRLRHFKMLVENVRPDMMLFHDDWGAKNNLFMSPEIWREFIKPAYEKLYGYLHDQGVFVMHHADSHLEKVASDLEDIHIDIWQGALPQNNIPKIQKEIRGNMILMGGIDASVVDHKDPDEKVIRKEVDRACREYLPGGHFIPCLTYGGPGAIFEGVDPIIDDELDKINSQLIQGTYWN